MRQTLFASLALVLLLAAPVQSQEALSFKLGVSGGGTVPTEDARHYNHTGFNVGVFLDVSRPNAPVGVRLEAQHNRLDAKGSFASSQITSAGLDLVVNSDQRIRSLLPFFSIGAGAYHIKTSFQPAPINYAVTCPVNGCGTFRDPPTYGSVTKVGLNGGAGLRVPMHGLDTFVEARYHWISTRGAKDLRNAITFVPISFGLTF